MDFDELKSLLNTMADPVILMEGRRSIPAGQQQSAFETARSLAGDFKHVTFRSGNASGSDYAFSRGVASVDPSRLQILAPYRGHRKKHMFSGAEYIYPDALPSEHHPAIIQKALQASPRHKSILGRTNLPPKVAVKAGYLLRDTIKAAGCPPFLTRPVAALFYVDPADTESGGTGHTIRVCRLEKVPVYFQDEWKQS
ncbi:hypothetical protein [Desulfonatronospira sp.]|uniref:hypothetical protein n=1 Tax=Desulfonatronospira sp. TaxID=1962951 RepID=UPI0025BCFEB2|nr:hypothetical protein [Desulfonatronospira sp.]